MMALEQAFRLVNIFASGIVVGGQVFCLLAVLPALRGWPADMGVRVHQDALTTRPESYLKPSAITSMFSAIILLLLMALQGDAGTASFVLTGLGLLGGIGNTFISARWEWPINNEINSWATNPLLDRYPLLRQTWDSRHTWRTISTAFAMVCFVLAALVR